MAMTPTKITIQYAEGTLTVTDRGVFFEGWDDDPLDGGSLTNEQLYSLVIQEFDHYQAVRKVLGLKKGASLHERMCPKLSVEGKVVQR